MSETVFPTQITAVVTTLTELFRHQNKTELCEILESSQARFDLIEYEGYNGEIANWALRLEVPIPLFVTLEERLEPLERAIQAKLIHFDRKYSGHRLGSVSITPLPPDANIIGIRTAVPDAAAKRLWPQAGFKLFVSHVSAHREAAGKLRDELALRGITAFVAHDAIEPSREWQNEIELALRSAQALAALITPDFHLSQWTDQEVGWALCRGLLIVPVQLGAIPYGFINKVQAIAGNLAFVDVIADSITSTLLTNPQTHGEMRRALVSAFCRATSFASAKLLRNYVIQVTDFTDDEKSLMRLACTENTQVAGAFGVPESVYRIVGRPPEPKPAEYEDVPF